MDVGVGKGREKESPLQGVLRPLAPREAIRVRRTCEQFRILASLVGLGSVLLIVLACAAWTRLPPETPLGFINPESARRGTRGIWLTQTLLGGSVPPVALLLAHAVLPLVPPTSARGRLLRRWASPELWPVLLLHVRTLTALVAWTLVPLQLGGVLACIGYHRGLPMPGLVPVLLSVAVFLMVIASVRFARAVGDPPALRVTASPWVLSSTP